MTQLVSFIDSPRRLDALMFALHVIPKRGSTAINIPTTASVFGTRWSLASADQRH
jgi:hypothetical protein